MAENKVLTDIAEIINLIPQDGYKYGKDVGDKILAKIREVVEGAELTPEEIIAIGQSHGFYAWGNDNIKQLLEAHTQAILKALGKED